jgi:N-acetylmuramic acid 6-phosphate etherase
VHYVGAGTSGRLAAADAAEVFPTFGIDAFCGHMAGGAAAMLDGAIDHEDSAEVGGHDIAHCTAGDVVIGISASGGTAYVRGALEHARSVGAHAVLLSMNPSAPLASIVHEHLCIDTGAEVLTGSTRLTAGTATKVVLSMISTATMVRHGAVWQNLMVGVQASNAKARDRIVALLCEASGRDADEVREAHEKCGDPRVTLVSLLCAVDAQEARQRLEAARWSVREAVRESGDA